MTDLYRTAEKVQQTMRHLERALADDEIPLALAAAKRGRRELTLLVQQLAEQRDNNNATTQEGTSK